MKLLSLLAILPSAFAITLTYPTEITNFTFTYTNPDAAGDSGSAKAYGPTNSALISDGDLTTGETLTYPGTEARSWGNPNTPTTQGMVGEFEASDLFAGASKLAFSITAASITFDSGCFGTQSSANAYYYDLSGNRAIIQSTTTSISNGYITFSADIVCKPCT